MSGVGYIHIKAYTSRAQIPLEDVAVSVLDAEGKLLALRVTDQSGNTTPISVQVPNATNSQSPQSGRPIFTKVNIYARAEGYEQVLARDVQVFEHVVTTQELPMIPLAAEPRDPANAEIFDTPPQNL